MTTTQNALALKAREALAAAIKRIKRERTRR